MKEALTACLLIVVFLTACAAATPTALETVPPVAAVTAPSTESAMSFKLTSDAFAHGQSIPAKYTCVGRNISPALAWTDPPAGTQSLALLVEDPDAPGGTWVHWMLYNIPAERRRLEEDLPLTGKNVDPSAIFVGKNSWGDIGYGGPCPPSGTHRYFFRLYALDTVISLLPGATKADLVRELNGHSLAEAELLGTFSK